ncbi:MAG: MFS transporter [Chloroflexi bacterium]|nr:MFS transporter [Chloroflexota bacterium]
MADDRTAAQRPALALVDKLFYGAGSLGNSALFYGMALWLVYFYAPPPESGLPILVSVGLIGLALAVGRVIETFDDPIIGWWSDTTRSRWGRRIPFLLFGTPLLALTFWLLWRPPVAHQSVLNAIYFFVVLEAFFLVNTIVSAPYEALQAEIALTSRDRVSVSAWKVAFGSAGAALALTVSPLLVRTVGFAGMGLVLGLAAFAALYVTLFGLWTRSTMRRAPTVTTSIPLLESVRTTFSHRPFLAFAASYTLFYLGFNMLAQLLPYYVQVVLGASEERVAWYTAGIIGLIVGSLPVMAFSAARWGKRAVYALAMLVLALYLPVLGVIAFVPLAPGIPLAVQSLAVIWLAGVPFSALFVFPGPLMADIIDDDARRTGYPRAALYYGMQSTLQKLALAGSAGLFGLLLQVFGFSAEQPLGIRLVGPVAGLCILLGYLAFAYGYRLKDEPASDPEATPECI